MKRLSVFTAAALLLCIAVALSVAPTSSGQGRKSKVKKKARPVAGQYIVTLQQWAAQPFGDNSFAPNIAADIVSQHRGQLKHVFKHALLGFTARLTPEAAEALADDPRVESVEEDGVVSATQTPSTNWGLYRIDKRDLPLGSSYSYTWNGTGVHVYVIDTGIRTTHTKFGGRANGDGFTSIADGNGTYDCNGHGTHVAGIIGSSNYGAANGVTLHPVRVLDCTGNGTDSTVIAGVDWVTANHLSPAVANVSVSGGISTALDTAVQNSINSGVTYAIAAGNDYGGDACYKSPGRVAAAITVGSTASNDTRSDFSNMGPCIDLYAPGSSIPSLWNTSDTATNMLSGTSMAAPHVAGVAAIYLQSNPTASPAAVRDQIVNTATISHVSGLSPDTPNRLLYSRLTMGGGSVPPPYCTGGVLYTGSLSGTGATAYQPNGNFFYSAVSGTHKGCLVGNSGNFNIYLQKWNGSTWVRVTSLTNSSSNETIGYTGTPGYYTWEVYSASGSGSYNLSIVIP